MPRKCLTIKSILLAHKQPSLSPSFLNISKFYIHKKAQRILSHIKHNRFREKIWSTSQIPVSSRAGTRPMCSVLNEFSITQQAAVYPPGAVQYLEDELP